MGQPFGSGHVWRALTRLGAWIEPVLVTEWARLMRRYSERMALEIAHGAAEGALAWEEPERDTRLARLATDRLRAAGMPVTCVWSGAALGAARLDIDHCLPWSAWPCGDLWNLMPADRRINQHQKRDRLPSQATLAAARTQIIGWWQAAWLDDPALGPKFLREVAAALPVEADPGADEIYSALEWRRLRLRQDQQIPEWAFSSSL